jgi:hypothetical protein
VEIKSTSRIDPSEVAHLARNTADISQITERLLTPLSLSCTEFIACLGIAFFKSFSLVTPLSLVGKSAAYSQKARIRISILRIINTLTGRASRICRDLWSWSEILALAKPRGESGLWRV